MTEIAIALGRPVLTPEVRAWINNRPGPRPVLTRGRTNGSNQRGLLLRLDVQTTSEAETQEELDELMTDLRMLGLHPTLLPADAH